MEFALNAKLQCILFGYKPIIGTINQPFDSFKISEYKIPVYSNYSSAKYEEFE